ncbi:hypothetical protein GCM10023080_027720 [Streptomyces pseudoechinosporeus]
MPGASRPERTASRNAACKERPRARAGAEATGSSSSQAAAQAADPDAPDDPDGPEADPGVSGGRLELVPDGVMKVDLKPDRWRS